MALNRERIQEKINQLNQDEKTLWANLNQVLGQKDALIAVLKEMDAPEEPDGPKKKR